MKSAVDGNRIRYTLSTFPVIRPGMEIRVLRYFEAIARLGNITRAATELHIAQPALSVAIKKLEDEIGVELLTRVRNKPISLTPEGVLLLARAKRIL